MINNVLIAVILLAVLYAIYKYQQYRNKKEKKKQVKQCEGGVCTIPEQKEEPPIQPVVAPIDKIDDVDLDGISQLTLGSYDIVNENIQEAKPEESVGSLGSLLEADAPNYL